MNFAIRGALVHPAGSQAMFRLNREVTAGFAAWSAVARIDAIALAFLPLTSILDVQPMLDNAPTTLAASSPYGAPHAASSVLQHVYEQPDPARALVARPRKSPRAPPTNEFQEAGANCNPPSNGTCHDTS